MRNTKNSIYQTISLFCFTKKQKKIKLGKNRDIHPVFFLLLINKRQKFSSLILLNIFKERRNVYGIKKKYNKS